MKPTVLAAISLGVTLSALPAQTTWQPNTSINPTPAGRILFGFAYDSHHGYAILFGGRVFGGTYTNETWKYDGANWTQLSPSATPPGIATNIMVYDSARQRMVLFGGANSFGYSAETWEWNGSNWLQRFPAVSPPARNGGAAAYDPLRRRMVLFGGWNGTRMQDTWEYDGNSWSQINTASHPSGRSDHEMIYDEGRQRMVMFGGYNDVSQFLGDTWEYDGVDWTQVGASGAPPLADPAIAYDRGLGGVVLFGGKTTWANPNVNQTFLFNGSTWADISGAVGTAPTGRWVAQMVYDEAHGRCVAFGGIDNFNLFPGDTSELATANISTHRTFGLGCPGTAGSPQLLLDGDRLPRLGSAWGLRLQNLSTALGTTALFAIGFSDTSSQAGPLPHSLASMGLPGCTLYVDPLINVYPLAFGGVATHAVAIPNQAWLLGVHLFVQGGVFDAAANVPGLVLSEAADGRIGF